MQEYKEIKLTNGMVALVDEQDYEYLNQYAWYATNGANNCSTFYAWRNITRGGKRGKLLMHREILGLDSERKLFGDHKDHNGLNNQRSNLRIATHSQNCANRKPLKIVTTSKYMGVHWGMTKNKGKVYHYWVASIRTGGKKITLGSFKNEI